MSDKSDKHLCFCGSGLSMDDCCGPIIAGNQPAETAEALMRSRYTAYVQENTEYILASWHPSTRPQSMSITPGEIHWTGLQVLNSKAGQKGDKTGRVEFIARFEHGNGADQVHEDSRFLFEQGQWFYVDGEMKSSKKVGRNDPCPCGSGKKYKKCCG